MGERRDAGRGGRVNLPVLNQVRGCDGCAVCCRVYDAARDDGTVKPGGVWCENAAPAADGYSCSIYAERWQTCRDFVCLWAAGVLPEELAPRRARAVVRASGRLLIVNELSPGAHRAPAFRRWLTAVIARRVPVLILGDRGADGPRILYDLAVPEGVRLDGGQTHDVRHTVPR